MGRAFRYQRRTSHIVVCSRRAPPGRTAAPRGCCGGSGIAQGRCGSREEGSSGAYRKKEEAGWKVEEVAGGSFGTEDTSIWVPAGYNKPWKSRWYADRDYADLLHEDVALRTQLKDKLRSAGISSIDIERAANKLVIRLFTARPGIIIGRKGAEIDKLKGEIQKRTKREVHIDIQEVHRPELDAQLVAESIALQLEKRVAFRRAMRKAVDSALRFGCKGIKIRVAGRLNARKSRARNGPARTPAAANAARRHRLWFRPGAYDVRNHWREVLGLSRGKNSRARAKEAVAQVAAD